MSDNHQSLETVFENSDNKEHINNLYIKAGFISKLFGCWAGKYSRWVNKNNGLYDSTDVAYIQQNNTTEVLTDFINDQVDKMYGGFRIQEESEDGPKFNTYKLIFTAFK